MDDREPRFLERHPWVLYPLAAVGFAGLLGETLLSDDTKFFLGMVIALMVLVGLMMWLIAIAFEEAELDARERKVRRAEIERREAELKKTS